MVNQCCFQVGNAFEIEIVSSLQQKKSEKQAKTRGRGVYIKQLMIYSVSTITDAILKCVTMLVDIPKRRIAMIGSK